MKQLNRQTTLRTITLTLFLAVLLAACGNAGKKAEAVDVAEPAEPVQMQDQDRMKLDQVFETLGDDVNMTVSQLVSGTGLMFLGTPYVAHTLETEPEQLVINLSELDCTTFAENCLALARTIHSGEETDSRFAAELKQIRYREGILDGYPSRLHYFCDWIYDNAKKGLVRDCSQELGGIRLDKETNFMSTHPESYAQLENDSTLVEAIRRQEAVISARDLYYIPEEQVEEAEGGLQEGDIAGITTSIEGIAIMHVVILVRRDGRIHLLHASSAAGQVVVSDETLSDYLRKSEKATGIMVARPL
jgi:hypothetical protein